MKGRKVNDIIFELSLAVHVNVVVVAIGVVVFYPPAATAKKHEKCDNIGELLHER